MPRARGRPAAAASFFAAARAAFAATWAKRPLSAVVAALCIVPSAVQADPAADISAFRRAHGQSGVVTDAALTRIAREQALAMAAKDQLEHDVIGGFSSRINRAGAGRAAENIAYGHDSFAKTLDQWVDSTGHRKNLLLPGASRVGVASAKSAATGRTYWAMEIAGDYQRRPTLSAGPNAGPSVRKPAVTAKHTAEPACRLSLLGLCLKR